jgi:dTDP-4-amino-4,6-dideoxygalactose transaminase
MTIAIAKPALGREEEEAVCRVLRSGWLTQGKEVAAFEDEFAALVGAKHAIAVSNCTTALHAALLAAGIGPGDEVITVSLSFIATANAVRYCGAVPVFVDVEAGTYNIDPAKIEAAIGPRTRAILAVHQMGMPADLAAISAIADQYGLVLLEDAAAAVGSRIRLDGAWRMIGRPHGLAACFSFHPRKILTCGEGGMITTDDDGLALACRRLRHHGMTISDAVRHDATTVTIESYDRLGYNYRMTDLQAAIGRVQLGRLTGLIETRRGIAALYREALADCPAVHLPVEPDWARSSWQSYCVRLAPGFSQQAVMQALLDQGIASRRAVMCAHREPVYQTEPCRIAPQGLGVSDYVLDNGIILPLHQDMSETDVLTVTNALKAAVTKPMAKAG